MEVTVEDFEWQLDWLSQNREVVDLETAVRKWNEPGSDRLVVLTFDDGYLSVYENGLPLLVERGLPFTLYLATKMLEKGEDDHGVATLTWKSVGSMLQSGLLTVGAHTHSHTDLRRADRAAIRKELDMSDSIIQERLGIRPVHFAYPWGYWSGIAEPMLIERYATAVLGGSPRPVQSPPLHRLHRYPVQLADGVSFFGARVRGGLRGEEWLRRRVRGYQGP